MPTVGFGLSNRIALFRWTGGSVSYRLSDLADYPYPQFFPGWRSKTERFQILLSKYCLPICCRFSFSSIKIIDSIFLGLMKGHGQISWICGSEFFVGQKLNFFRHTIVILLRLLIQVLIFLLNQHFSSLDEHLCMQHVTKDIFLSSQSSHHLCSDWSRGTCRCFRSCSLKRRGRDEWEILEVWKPGSCSLLVRGNVLKLHLISHKLSICIQRCATVPAPEHTQLLLLWPDLVWCLEKKC